MEAIKKIAAEAKPIDDKMGELVGLLKEILGGDCDFICIVHRRHTPEEQCDGVVVLAPDGTEKLMVHQMLSQGIILTEGAIIKEQMENYPPPGQRLN